MNEQHRKGDNVALWVSKAFPFSSKLISTLDEGVPVIIDFDDHDISLGREFRSQSLLNRIKLNPLRQGSPERVRRSQLRALVRSDALTVSSFALASVLKLPGKKMLRVPHARPGLANETNRTAATRFAIGFLGTMRGHKGLSDIEAALAGDSSLSCVTFRQEGLSVSNPARWRFLDGNTPLSEAYSQVSVAVLPMGESDGAQFQLPAKAIDAAASGTPIVASPSPVLDEYFGSAVLYIDDWATLGHKLTEWNKNGSLDTKSRELLAVWEEKLNEDVVRQSVATMFGEIFLARGRVLSDCDS